MNEYFGYYFHVQSVPKLCKEIQDWFHPFWILKWSSTFLKYFTMKRFWLLGKKKLMDDYIMLYLSMNPLKIEFKKIP